MYAVSRIKERAAYLLMDRIFYFYDQRAVSFLRSMKRPKSPAKPEFFFIGYNSWICFSCAKSRYRKFSERFCDKS